MHNFTLLYNESVCHHHQAFGRLISHTDSVIKHMAAANPPPATPDEVKEMCAYLGIDLQREFFLLPVAKRAVEAPLPAQWREQRDEANDRSVFVDADGGIHERHPMDESFKQSVRLLFLQAAAGDCLCVKCLTSFQSSQLVYATCRMITLHRSPTCARRTHPLMTHIITRRG